MGAIEKLRDLFRRTTCVRLVSYSHGTLDFSGVSADAGGAKFSLGEFKFKREKVETVSEMAKALDDYQLLICQLIRGLKEHDPERRVQIKSRAAMILLITKARIVLAAFRANPKKEARNLDLLVKKMLDFNEGIVKPVTKDRYQLTMMTTQRPSVSMSSPNLTCISMEQISDTLRFTGIEENKLDDMIASL